ncbi:hypothetical protein ACJMK2_015857 [Sinanodonta woodiana]|uniref:Uncharacterized protein n=1 Tax=Sinanodonta woodiana TaxID=1069815 RepID=A0ABD3UVI4_SINWO
MTEANPYFTLLENVWPPPDENTVARYRHLQELHEQRMSRERSLRGIDASDNSASDSETGHAGSQQNRTISSGEVPRHRIHNRDFSQLIRRRPRSIQINDTDRSLRSVPEPVEVVPDSARPRLSELKFDNLLADFEASFPDTATILARTSRGSIDAGISSQNRISRPTLTRSRSDASRFSHRRNSQDSGLNSSRRTLAPGTNGDSDSASNINLATGMLKESKIDSGSRNLVSEPLRGLEQAFSNATASILGTDLSSSRILGGHPNATTNYQRFVMSSGTPTVSRSTAGYRSRDNIASIQEQCDSSDTTESPRSIDSTTDSSISSVLDIDKVIQRTSSDLQHNQTMQVRAAEFQIEFDENDTIPVLGSGDKRVIYIDKKGITHYLKPDHPFLIALSRNIITKVSEYSRNSIEGCQQMASSRRAEGQLESNASSNAGSVREHSVRSNTTIASSTGVTNEANSASSTPVKFPTGGLSADKTYNEGQKEKDMNSEMMESVDFLINRLGVVDIDPNALSLEELKEIQRALSEELNDEDFPLENVPEIGQNVFQNDDVDT